MVSSSRISIEAVVESGVMAAGLSNEMESIVTVTVSSPSASRSSITGTTSVADVTPELSGSMTIEPLVSE